MQLQKLYSRRSDGGLQQWVMEVEGSQYRVTSGKVGGKQAVNAWTVAVPKNAGRANETTPEQQAKLEAQAVWDRKHSEGYRPTEAELSTVTLFEPMLAHKYKDYPEIMFPVYVQPKLDGIRMIGKPDGLYTRKGKPHLNMEHVAKDLAKVFKGHSMIVTDGEAYADKLSNDFNQIVHLVKQQKPTAQDKADSAAVVKYHVYDCFLKDHPEYTFSARQQEIRLALADCPTVQLVATYLVTCQEELDAKHAEFAAAGYEGTMIRQDTPYENKRTKALLKHKEFIDAEYTIAGVEEGIGNRAGGAGAIVLDKVGKAGIRGNLAFFTRLWQERKDLIGKQATIRYQGITPDGKLRFPVCVAIRDYD